VGEEAVSAVERILTSVQVQHNLLDEALANLDVAPVSREYGDRAEITHVTLKWEHFARLVVAAQGDDRLEDVANNTPLTDLPVDVQKWLMDTYTPRGISIWLRMYTDATEDQREHMFAVARCDSGGT
jgi:hypothetical protein